MFLLTDRYCGRAHALAQARERKTERRVVASVLT